MFADPYGDLTHRANCEVEDEKISLLQEVILLHHLRHIKAMAIVETWCPPSREHWELLIFLWQFFPFVCPHILTGKTGQSFTNSGYTVHTLPMAILLLSYGQDLHRVSLQRAGEDRMGYNGGTWVHYTVVLDVLAAEAGRN